MSSRNGRKWYRHFHLTPKPLVRVAPTNAGAVPPVLRRSTAPPPRRSPQTVEPGVCACQTVFPVVPGWPGAIVSRAVIDVASFWGSVLYPSVCRLLALSDMTPEDADLIETGYFVFLVRPNREDADMQALAELLRAQGGPLAGDPVDLSGDGKFIVQIVAVLVGEGRSA